MGCFNSSRITAALPTVLLGHGSGVYYAWNRPAETTAPLGVIENRFPALFESRRILYPRYAELADPERFDQGIGGFLDHILRRNFVDFVERTRIAVGTLAMPGKW